MEEIMIKTRDNKGEQRNSSIELLRLFSIWGIIVMHLYGSVYNTAQGLNLYGGVLINSIFNIGVTCFVLISGYYGVKLKIKKLIELELLVLCYTFFDLILKVVHKDDISITTIVYAVLPVSLRRFWYISCYFALMLLAPFLNAAVEKISQRDFKRLLFTLLMIFSIIPTFLLKRDLMLDDGKGLANIVTVYMIGRYIHKYDVKVKRKVLYASVLSLIVGNCLLNAVTTKLSGNIGIFAPFARDCSIIIILLAVAVFLMFQSIHFYNKVVNHLSSAVLAMYIFEGILRDHLQLNLFVENSISKNLLIPVLLIIAIGLMIICFVMETIRKLTINPVFEYLFKKSNHSCKAFYERWRRILG